MPRPQQVTDEQILEAVRRAVLESGTQVSLDVVAERIGVTAPALIKRFGTRQRLLILALRPDQADLDAVFDVATRADCPFVEQLESILDRLSTYFTTSLPRVMALRGCGFKDAELREHIDEPMPLRAVAATTRWLDELGRQKLIRSDTIATAATAIVGAVSMRTLSTYLSKRPWSRRSQLLYQKQLADLFGRSLCPAGRDLGPTDVERSAPTQRSRGSSRTKRTRP